MSSEIDKELYIVKIVRVDRYCYTGCKHDCYVKLNNNTYNHSVLPIETILLFNNDLTPEASAHFNGLPLPEESARIWNERRMWLNRNRKTSCKKIDPTMQEVIDEIVSIITKNDLWALLCHSIHIMDDGSYTIYKNEIIDRFSLETKEYLTGLIYKEMNIDSFSDPLIKIEFSCDSIYLVPV